jgi:hypothetical protein
MINIKARTIGIAILIGVCVLRSVSKVKNWLHYYKIL